jgi:uncharacterized protein (TIGR00106 family)
VAFVSPLFFLRVPEEAAMIAQFSIVPLGAGVSLSHRVSRVLAIVRESGIPYKVNPMGTVVEGEWDDVLGLIRKCRDELMADEERLLISITIDDRKGATGRIEGKVAALERRLGTTLNT